MNRKFSILLLLFSISTAGFTQKTTIYFYRLKNLFLASTDLGITVNDSIRFTLSNGTYYKLETTADSISIETSLNNIGLKGFKPEKGKTYYIQAELRTLNSVELWEQTEFSGKPAIERLEADKMLKDSEKLSSVKVTTVTPLPEAKEDAALIYLFRPFNVAGVNLIANISDGKTVYEMKNNSSIIISKEAGEITLRTMNEGKNTSNTSLKLNLEKGRVYYVAVLRTGGALVLTETKAEYAKKEMKLE